jgi:predicted Zn-dependent protease
VKRVGTLASLCVVVAIGCATSPDVTRPRRPASDGATTPAALYARGLAWARRGDMVRAEQYMALAVRAGFPERRALVAIVDACLAASRLRAALNYAEPYLRRHPDAWRVRLLVASIHAALGHDLVARDELRRAGAHPDAAPETHYFLAALLDQRFGDEVGARAGYSTYVALAPAGEHAAEAAAWLAEHAMREAPSRDGPKAERR